MIANDSKSKSQILIICFNCMIQVIIVGIEYSVYYKVRKKKCYIEINCNFSNQIFTKHLYKKYHMSVFFNKLIVNT